MKTFILTEGGKSIGYGHVTRCLSTCQSLQDNGISPIVIINGDDEVSDFMRGLKCVNMDWVNDSIGMNGLIEDADAVIIDSYRADLDVYRRVADIAMRLISFDDNMRIDYPRGYVVNGNAYATQLPYPIKNEITYCIGTEYLPMRREYRVVPEKTIRKDVESLLITFGGDDTKKLIPPILKELNNKYRMMRKYIIVGHISSNIDNIRKVADRNTTVFCNPTTAEIKDVMGDVDIALSGGGQTLYELARMGTPTVGVCIEEDQKRNISFMREKGYISFAGHSEDKEIADNVLNKIELMRPRSVRTEQSIMLSGLVDGKGADRLVQAIMHGKDTMEAS